jgi:hypothetical protein
MVFAESAKGEAQTTLPNLRVEPTFFWKNPVALTSNQHLTSDEGASTCLQSFTIGPSGS